MAKEASVRIVYAKVKIEADLGSEAPQITDGFGGWEEVERYADLSLTRWSGTAPLRMTLPLWLDGYGDNQSVQRDLDRLRRLGRTKDGDREPPVFRVSGPVPFSGTRWVMESSPEEGDSYRGKDGRLLRQAITLTLMQYVRPDRIKIKRRRGGGGPEYIPPYTTKEGDTLLKIARKLRPQDNARESIKYAKEIGSLNKIRDIRKRLDKGLRLRLP